MPYYNTNNLSIRIFEPLSNTAIPDNTGVLINGATVQEFETMYPGGIFGAAKIHVPQSPLKQWNPMKIYPYRYVIYNNSNVVYEGWVDEHILSGGSGITIPLIGAWGFVGKGRGLRRLWKDNRVTDDIWEEYGDTTEKVSVDRNERIRITPRGADQAWANTEQTGVKYTAPTGEKIIRVTYDYDVTSVNNEDWSITLYGASAGTVDAQSRTTTGQSTGTVDHTFGTSESVVSIRIRSDTAQTPAPDGTSGDFSYVEASNIMVYCETNNGAGYSADADDIMADIVAEFSSHINSDTQWIGTNSILGGTSETDDPFITGKSDGSFELVADIMERLYLLGDTTNDAWAAGFLESRRAATPDGKPVVYYEQQPALTDFDYIIDANDDNINASEIEFSIPIGRVSNSIWVNYRDANRRSQWINEDDEATLASSSSQTRYTRRDISVDAGELSYARALDYGKRYLGQYQYATSMTNVQPFSVYSYIRTKAGSRVPASEIRAGKRVKMSNFISPVGANEDNIFLIQRTRYRSDGESCQIYPGTVETLDVLLANLQR